MACEERLANKRTNKSSYSSSCSNSYIRSYICSDKTLSILYCFPFLIPTATLSPPINYSQDSASISYAPFFCNLESLIACGELRFLCLCYTGFLSFRCAGKQGRTRTGVPTRTTRIKERLKARLFAFLKRKADYAIRGSTISPTLMVGGMLKTILLEAAFE